MSRKNVREASGPRARHPVLLATLGLSLALASCYPGEVTSTGELDVVATVHDDAMDFGAVNTFVLLDSVVHFAVATVTELPRDFDDQILADVMRNLTALGWTEETDPANNTPDVAVLVAATAVDNFNAYTTYPWYDYWGWYPYWPGYGPGYGIGYPPVTTVTQYRQGTLLIDIIDLNRADTGTETIPSAWIAAINGLLEGSGQSARLTRGIDQSFRQSPYLGGN